MHVFDKRKSVARLLRNDLDSDAVIVASPDHPLLLEGPDIIVGGKGGMLAVYFPKALERKRHDRLEARFTLSRLALPPDARHVLVLDEKHQLADMSYLSRNFASVLSWRERSDLSRIARDSSYSGGLNKVPDAVTRFVRRRFANALQATQIMQRIDKQQSTGEFGRSPLKDSRRQKSGHYERLAEDVLFKDLSRRHWNSIQVQNISNRTTRTGFSVDNGVPYPTAQDDYGVVLVDEFRDYRGDPEKLLRAAAFAGWGVVPTSQEHRIQAVAERLSKRRTKRNSA